MNLLPSFEHCKYSQYQNVAWHTICIFFASNMNYKTKNPDILLITKISHEFTRKGVNCKDIFGTLLLKHQIWLFLIIKLSYFHFFVVLPREVRLLKSTLVQNKPVASRQQCWAEGDGQQLRILVDSKAVRESHSEMRRVGILRQNMKILKKERQNN